MQARERFFPLDKVFEGTAYAEDWRTAHYALSSSEFWDKREFAKRRFTDIFYSSNGLVAFHCTWEKDCIQWKIMTCEEEEMKWKEVDAGVSSV